MTHRTVPQRHWRRYGNDPLPSGAEALVCGGRAGRVELLTGIEGVSSRPVRRIVLREG
jgi:hypothetical protein